jgi:2-polyprenyl-6-methoxyphenol hydroxylase-like FAD-dependent oxidoreductase
MRMRSSPAMFDVLIVGAGPAGSTAAILLASAGWSVALVEKQDFPRRKVCGECIAASNLPLLDALGIGKEFAAQAGPSLRRVAVLRAHTVVTADLPRAVNALHPWGRALGRETLDTLLLARAHDAGATLLQPWSVQDVAGLPGDYRCHVREVGTGQSRTIAARKVILAHGSWEPLPGERTTRRAQRRSSDLLAFKANFRGAGLEAGLLPVLAFDGGYGGMVLGDHGIVTVACCVRADRLEALRRAAPGLAAGAVVEAMLLRECAGVARALQAAERDGPWLASGPLAPGVRVGGSGEGDTLLRIGNAAGEAHPIVGEGISMALQSAALLCEALLRDGERGGGAGAAQRHQQLRQRHAARWRRTFAPRLALAATFAQLAMRPRSARLLLALFARWPSLLTHGAAWCGKADSAVSPDMLADIAGRTRTSAD